MDAILFYGDRGDASRRQVRSAAAQHSHKIGPRKPKASKKPHAPLDAGLQKKRSIKANTTSKSETPIAAAAAAGQAGKLAAAPAPRRSAHSSAPKPPAVDHDMNVFVADAVSLPIVLESPTPNRANGLVDGEKEAKRRAAQIRFQEIQTVQQAQLQQQQQQQQQHHHHQHHNSPQSQHQPLRTSFGEPKLTAPETPGRAPLVIERTGHSRQDNQTPAHSRTNSQASPQSPSTRLPQYSWTEYPRYGLSPNNLHSSLQMLAHVAVAERDAVEAASPLAPPSHEVPGFRQFGTDAPKPQKQPYPPSQHLLSQSPPSAPPYSPPAGQAPVANRSNPGSQPPPLAVQPLTNQPVAAATFGQFLHNAINGYGSVDAVQRHASSTSADDPIQDEKPHLSSG